MPSYRRGEQNEKIGVAIIEKQIGYDQSSFEQNGKGR